MQPDDFQLRDEPRPEWDSDMSLLLASDAWLAKKYNRQRRLKEKIQYIDEFLAKELKGTLSSWIIDLGPGPGEFLEVCERLGHRAMGIEGRQDGIGGMGSNYCKLSEMLHARQQLSVSWCGLEAWLDGSGPRFNPRSVQVINSQGSIEQALCRYMIGEPHDTHHDAERMAWRIDEVLLARLGTMMGYFARILKKGGCFFCYANGSTNHAEFYEALDKAADETGAFVIHRDISDGKRIKPTLRKYTRNGERK